MPERLGKKGAGGAQKEQGENKCFHGEYFSPKIRSLLHI
jgi:hypothetical protein